MTADNTSANEKTEDQGFMNELEEFLGEEVSEQLSRMTNKALRDTDKKDAERLKEFKETYQRPKNVDSLQIPAVDEVIWRQLQSNTKNVDFMLQKVTGNYSLALTPLLKSTICIKQELSL